MCAACKDMASRPPRTSPRRAHSLHRLVSRLHGLEEAMAGVQQAICRSSGARREGPGLAGRFGGAQQNDRALREARPFSRARAATDGRLMDAKTQVDHVGRRERVPQARDAVGDAARRHAHAHGRAPHGRRPRRPPPARAPPRPRIAAAGRPRAVLPPADVPPPRFGPARPPAPASARRRAPPQPTFDGEVFNKTSIGIGVMATVVGGAGVICFAAFFQNKKHGFIK